MFPQPQKSKKLPETPNERRHRLRRTAGHIMGEFSRVSGCGRKRISDHVTVARTASGNVQYHGLMTCGSIWQCPVCAGRIASKRSVEVAELLQAHDDVGGAVYMATLTVRHRQSDQIGDVRDLVRDAWTKTLQGRIWQELKTHFGIVGYVRSLELTHGKHGWHPHLHVLFFTAKPVQDDAQLANALFSRWADAVETLEGSCEISAFDFRRATNVSAAADYVSKWGAGSEISKGAEKDGRMGSLSPWQLLEKADKGHAQSVAIWKAYATAMHRARHMTYSVGIRELYNLREPLPDAQLSLETETIARELYSFDEATWSQVVKQKLTGVVLDAARSDDPFAIDKTLLAHGIGIRQRPTQYGHAPNPNAPTGKSTRFTDWLGLGKTTLKGQQYHAQR
jgi:Replication protein